MVKAIKNIRVNDALCKGCGICIQLCPKSVFQNNLGRPVVQAPERCSGCRNCELWCPDFALDLEGQDHG